LETRKTLNSQLSNAQLFQESAVFASKWMALSATGVVVLVGGGIAGMVALDASGGDAARLADAPLDGGRAYRYLVEVCEFGPRPSGSEALGRLRQRVVDHYQQHGAEVALQAFPARHPLDGGRVEMVNIIARWKPDARRRIVLGAHYDTRPRPDRDPDPAERTGGTFVGANDGASGVALFMELAHHLGDWPTQSGIDLVLFDGEELVFDEVGEYFLGSTHFARQYRAERPPYRYTLGVVVDMIADADLQIYQEGHSVRLAPQLVRELWSTAGRLGVREFQPRVRHTVRDDHLPLNLIADIPTVNLIDFDYPPWHTTADTPERCSADSLTKVGWVLLEWLRGK
jgi:hypothetical protein